MIDFETRVFRTTQKYLSRFQWFEKVRAKKKNTWTRVRLWELVIEWRKIERKDIFAAGTQWMPENSIVRGEFAKVTLTGQLEDGGQGNDATPTTGAMPCPSHTNETTGLIANEGE